MTSLSLRYTIKTVANPINGSYISEIRILDFLDFTFPLISYLTLSFNIKNLSCQIWQVKWYQFADIGMQRKNWPKKGVGMHEEVCCFLVFPFFGAPALTSWMSEIYSIYIPDIQSFDLLIIIDLCLFNRFSDWRNSWRGWDCLFQKS